MSIPLLILFIVFAIIWLYLLWTLGLMIMANKNEEFKKQYFKKRGRTVGYMIKVDLFAIAFVTVILGLLLYIA